jgi:hypothetical protein
MSSIPLYKRPNFWRGFTAWGLLILFIISFRDDLTPALRGWWDLFLILFFKKSPPLDAILLHSMFKMTANIVVYLMVFLISIFVMAQFVLPVTSLKDRFKAFWRVLLYMTPLHGPAVFVRDGKLISRIDEEDNINPGVALVDLRSAIVLENEASSSEDDQEEHELDIEVVAKKKSLFVSRKSLKRPKELEQASWVRVGGPGINFTNYGEKIRDVVDLRRQVRTESNVTAFTRDGIEVSTNVFAVFSISEAPEIIPVAYVGGNRREHLFKLDLITEPNNTFIIKEKFELDSDDAEEIHQFVESGKVEAGAPVNKLSSPQPVTSPYLFDPQRILAAAYGQTQTVLTDQNTQWHELPQMIASELFRNLIGHYTYDYLYQFNDPDNKILPWIDEFKPELSRKLMYQGLLSYKLVRLVSPLFTKGERVSKWNEIPLEEDNFGHPLQASDLEITSPRPLTAAKSLRARGIKIIAAGFTEMKVSSEMRSKMAERWSARWERDIASNRAHQEREAMQVINSARTQKQRDSTFLLSNMLKQEPHSKEALALLLFQSLETAATNEKGYKDFPPKEVLSMLQNLHRWLLIERQEMEAKKKKNDRNDGHDGSPPAKDPEI